LAGTKILSIFSKYTLQITVDKIWQKIEQHCHRVLLPVPSMYLILPTEQQRENARSEFKATVQTVKQDVQLLIDWITKQPHLPTITGKNSGVSREKGPNVLK